MWDPSTGVAVVPEPTEGTLVTGVVPTCLSVPALTCPLLQYSGLSL
jgi:hypothetical protein